jgi:hypothetical protein
MDTSWSTDIECFLEAVRQNCIIMSNEHRKRYFILQGNLRYFKVPVIVISAISSVLSVGLQPYMEQSHISITTCILALAVGILGSIELYLGIQSGMERELLSSKLFYLLGTDIFKVLSLAEAKRMPNAIAFLNEKYDEYRALFEDSNLLTKKVQDKLSPLPKDLESISSNSISNKV